MNIFHTIWFDYLFQNSGWDSGQNSGQYPCGNDWNVGVNKCWILTWKYWSLCCLSHYTYHNYLAGPYVEQLMVYSASHLPTHLHARISDSSITTVSHLDIPSVLIFLDIIDSEVVFHIPHTSYLISCMRLAIAYTTYSKRGFDIT